MSNSSYYASDSIGRNVINNKSDKIASVDDMVISEHGQVEYLILGCNGFLRLGEDKIAVPYNQFSWNHEKQALILNATKEQLTNAPKISKDHVPTATDAAYFGAVNTYYKDFKTAA